MNPSSLKWHVSWMFGLGGAAQGKCGLCCWFDSRCSRVKLEVAFQNGLGVLVWFCVCSSSADYLDNGNNKMAIQQADKLLKKHKDLHCAKVSGTGGHRACSAWGSGCSAVPFSGNFHRDFWALWNISLPAHLYLVCLKTCTDPLVGTGVLVPPELIVSTTPGDLGTWGWALKMPLGAQGLGYPSVGVWIKTSPWEE